MTSSQNPKHMRAAGQEAPARARDYADLPETTTQWIALGALDATEPGEAGLAMAEAELVAADGAVEASAAPGEPAASAAPDGSVTSESGQASVGRSAGMMSVLVIVSRLTGFFRTWGQAYAIGATMMASCYSIANNLPNQLYELVVAGMLTTAFLPVYMSVKRKGGIKGASEYTSNLVSIILLLMGAVTVLGFIFAAPLVWTQSFSATDEFDFDLAVYFFRFFVIEVVLYALSTIFSGVLNAERDYFWGAAAPIFNNFVTTASFLLYAALVDTNPQLALVLLALGNPLGVFVQVAVQWPSIHRHGVRLRLHINWHDPALKDTVKIGVPSLVVMGTSFVTSSVQVSSQLALTASGAAISSYARLWWTLPYAVLTVPITTAMFTELSDAWAMEDMQGFRDGISLGMSQIIFFMIPFGMYLCVFAMPLVSIISAGNFTQDQLQMTASYLCGMALSLPLFGVCMYLQKVCSAMRSMETYAIASVVASVAHVAMMLGLTPYFDLTFVALTSIVFYAIIDVVTFRSLRNKLGHIGLRSVGGATVRSLVLGAAGSVVGWGLLWLLARYLGPCDGTTMKSILYCVIAGIPTAAVTYGLALALKVPEASVVRSVLNRLLHRR